MAETVSCTWVTSPKERSSAWSCLWSFGTMFRASQLHHEYRRTFFYRSTRARKKLRCRWCTRGGIRKNAAAGAEAGRLNRVLRRRVLAASRRAAPLPLHRPHAWLHRLILHSLRSIHASCSSHKESGQIFQGSFSAVWRPIFASKH